MQADTAAPVTILQPDAMLEAQRRAEAKARGCCGQLLVSSAHCCAVFGGPFCRCTRNCGMTPCFCIGFLAGVRMGDMDVLKEIRAHEKYMRNIRKMKREMAERRKQRTAQRRERKRKSRSKYVHAKKNEEEEEERVITDN